MEEVNEESYIISSGNTTDNKSISYVINNSNSASSLNFNSSVTSVTSPTFSTEKSNTNSKSLKGMTKKILSKKNNSTISYLN